MNQPYEYSPNIMKAKDIILHFDLLDSYVRDRDSELGFMYVFPTLGISFWRGNVCNEEDLEADWFKELIPESLMLTLVFATLVVMILSFNHKK